MQELFARLQKILAAGGSNAADVPLLLQQIEATCPQQSWLAQAMVNGTLVGEGGQPDPPQSSWLTAKTLIPLLGGLGIGGGAAGLANISWEDLPKPPLPQVTNQWVLLAIVGAIGGIVGLAHSFYRNNWTLLLPSLSVSHGQLQIKTLGFVRNLIAAAVVSIATTWIAFANVAVGGPAATDSDQPSLLTWNIVMGAAAAGVFGSRMSSGEVEKNTLWQSLSTSVEAPAVAGLGKKVRNAKTPFDAAAIAAQASQTAQTEANLLAHFDRPALKAALTKLAKPPGPDGEGLTVALLKQFPSLSPTIGNLLGDFPVADVASMLPDSFAQEAGKRGVPSAFSDLLSRLQGDCVQVMKLLGSLPATWTWDPRRL